MEAATDVVYLDYNATTPLEGDVLQAIHTALKDAWANPSSSYPPGVAAKKVIEDARQKIAAMIKAEAAEDIVLTSGGTESNNQVIHSAIKHHHARGCPSLPHIITSCLEHDSIRLPLSALEKEGKITVTWVGAGKHGAVCLEDVMEAVTPNTCLVTIMLANNETGIIQPIGEIFGAVRKKHPHVLLHTDAAQAIGKISVNVNQLHAHYLTIVGHKFYGPRVGAVYCCGIGNKTPLYPMLYGGGQERSYRPGTENTGMIAGLGKAAELVTENGGHYELHMGEVRDYLEERLKAVFGNGVCFNGKSPDVQRLPNTCNFSFVGAHLNGRAVLSACRVIQASVGAACHSSAANSGSAVLLAMGVPQDIARNALRFSVGRHTTKADMDRVIADLQQAVAALTVGTGDQ